MGLFSRVTPESLRPLLLRIARLEGAHHPTAKFRERSPFSEERTRLFSLMAQDQQLPPAELARLVTADPEALTERAVAWQEGIDVAAESARLDEQIAASGRIFKRLMPQVGQYVFSGAAFGPKIAEKIHYQFQKMGCYFAFSPGRRGFLFGRIEAREVAGQPLSVLTDEVWSGRYNHGFRGQCDKVWEDLTFLRPDALAYAQALIGQVVTGSSAVESTYLRKAMGIYNQHYASTEQLSEDLAWWAARELAVRAEQRRAIRRDRSCPLIDDHQLAPAGYQEEFYWIFDGPLAELQLLLELAEHPDAERLKAARRVDRLVHFEPPVSEAAFYYDHRLFLLSAHLEADPVEQLMDPLRRLEEYDEYHQLMRQGWERIQSRLG